MAFGGEMRCWANWVPYLLGFEAGVGERWVRDRRGRESQEELLDGEYLPTLPAIRRFFGFFLVYTNNNIT